MSYRRQELALTARRRVLEAELAEVDEQLQGLSSRAHLPLLSNVRVANPCHANWDAMQGDERRRFCSICSQFVYNLSAMTAEEAEALLYETEGQICKRFYRREDGTILTKDCPVGIAKKRVDLALGAAAVALVAAAAATAAGFDSKDEPSDTARAEHTRLSNDVTLVERQIDDNGIKATDRGRHRDKATMGL